jgi:adenylate cyclase
VSTAEPLVDEIGSDPDAAGAVGLGLPGAQRARRLYLAQRRHELLSPLGAILEIGELLLREEAIRACDRARADLQTIHANVRRLAALINDALGLDRIAAEGPLADAVARALNHDMRSLLTIILGYGDELRRGLHKARLDDFTAEVEKIRFLARRALALVDSTVTHLRSPGGELEADDAQVYLERLAVADGGPAGELLDAPAAEAGLILVAEDNEVIRDLLCDLLRRQGHEVVAARDGFDALMLIHSRPFDLVLTDIEMPCANGFQVIDHLKADARLRDIPIIVISGHADLDGIAHCIKMGAEDYLPKPFNRVILKARVDACLEKKRLRDRTEQQRLRFNDLLHDILPAPIVEELTRTSTVRPQLRDNVAVLFADIVGFTPYCDRHQDQPELIVHYLQQLFEVWEEIASGFRVQKIKTIGDAFMAAAGLLHDVDNPVLDCVRCGLRMIEATQRLCDEGGQPIGWNLRVGVHIGPVVAGVLGRRQYLYDLWGDAVNIAARLESHGQKGCVNLSVPAWGWVSSVVRGESRALREIKGKPEPMEMISLDPATAVLLPGLPDDNPPVPAAPRACDQRSGPSRDRVASR